MSWFSKAIGSDGRRERRETAKWAPYGGTPQVQLQGALSEEASGQGYRDAFEETAGAYLRNAMPSFRSQLQLTREDGQRRGIGTGDLGTSYEGDLASAFEQNISDTLGSMAMSGYENNRNRYLDLLTGKINLDDANKNAGKNRAAGLAGGAIGAAGYYFGGRG